MLSVWRRTCEMVEEGGLQHVDLRKFCFLSEEYGSVASTPDSTPPCTDGKGEDT